MRQNLLLAGLLVLTGRVPLSAEPTQEERGRLVAEFQTVFGEFVRFYGQGKLEEALSRAERAVALSRQLFPKDQYPDGHPAIAGSLNNVGNVLEMLGRLEPALEHMQQALDMHRKAFPPQRFPDGHVELARNLNNVGVVLTSLGRLEPALEHTRAALVMRRRLFPPERFPDGHAEVAQSLYNLGNVLRPLGHREAALEHYQQALSMRRKLYSPERFPDGHNDLAHSLNSVGAALELLGRLEEALEHTRQALAMRQKLFSPDRFPNGHPDLAGTLSNVGTVLAKLGRPDQALECQQQALAMTRKLFPAERFPDGHSDLAQGLSSMGFVLEPLGRLEPALEYHQQALAMRRKVFPPARFPEGHPVLAGSLNNVGTVLDALGRREQALEYQQQALAMYRKFFPPERFPNGQTDLAASLNNVGILLDSLGRLEKALEYHQQALAMRRKLFPPDRFPEGHTDLAHSLTSVGTVLRSLRRLEPALEHQQEALAMCRKLFPPERFPEGHTDLARCLNCMGAVLQSQGRLKQALEHNQLALDMKRKLFPLDKFPDGHTDLAASLHNLGAALLASGQTARATDVLSEALCMERRLCDQQSQGAAESEALAFARAMPNSLNIYLSATADRPGEDITVYAQVWTQRAALSRILRRRHLAALAAADPEVGQLFARLQQTSHVLAALLRTPLASSAEAQRSRDRRVNELTQDKQRLQRELITLLPEADRQRPLDGLGPHDLANALPPNTAFVDLLRYFHWEFDPNKPGDGGTKLTARYVAFVVVGSQPGRPTVRRVELKDAEAIEQALADWRHLIAQEREQDQSRPAAELRRLLWEPLRKALPGPTRLVFLAPDAALTRLPFAALPGSKPGTVLLKDHALAVVPHGPFLLEQLSSLTRFGKGREGALALGGIDYSAAPVPLSSTLPTPTNIHGPGREGTAGPWSDLPGSVRELRLLGKVYGNKLTRLEGSRADVTRLLQALPRASLAHLSTHGFFNEKLFQQEQMRTGYQADSLLRSREVLREGPGGGITLGTLNPLSYTGLVLAGANKPERAGLHGGILTGEALLTVDLRGLELAVLSACQTGLGDVFNGECVHNLQQAFHSAGCPNVVASLWSVPDEPTAALMGLFYHGLLVEKLPPLEALRAAQLYLYRHPEEIPELVRRAERGAPLVAQGAPDPSPEPRPTQPPVEGKKRASARSWAGFVLSGVGR
jgi:tetratricopeptide (TPR) repeat protein/CHAT domain-containing protein